MTTGMLAVHPAALMAQPNDRVSADSARASQAQTDVPPQTQAPRKQWYERLSLRGYTQLRYNRLLETNPNLTCAQCDRSIGRNGGFIVRRGRLVLSGDVSDRVSIYIQPDFGSEVSGSLHMWQIRDAYFDLALDSAKNFRLRFGQSKVPFGWENLQSSSNRLPLDRGDPLNSALPNERDLGVFAYFSPETVRRRFRTLLDSGLKGSGDYGFVGIGAYNGQTANRSEANNNLHTVLRVSYPFRLANGQFIETGIQGYTGRFVIPASQRTSGVSGPLEFLDQRAAASLIIYPQPLGLQAEWNVGTGPEINLESRVIEERRLEGGYVQVMYRHTFDAQTLIPFVRAQRYDGAKKLETDARAYQVRELEIGAEWLPMAAFELTAMYTISSRRFEDAAIRDNLQKGQLLRLQAQFNY